MLPSALGEDPEHVTAVLVQPPVEADERPQLPAGSPARSASSATARRTSALSSAASMSEPASPALLP